MSQTEQILQMLRKGPVTPMDALQKAGCFRLAARIEELKRAGYCITTDMVNENGKRFAKYRLIEQKLERQA